MDYLCDVERIEREVAAASEMLLFELEGRGTCRCGSDHKSRCGQPMRGGA